MTFIKALCNLSIALLGLLMLVGPTKCFGQEFYVGEPADSILNLPELKIIIKPDSTKYFSWPGKHLGHEGSWLFDLKDSKVSALYWNTLADFDTSFFRSSLRKQIERFGPPPDSSKYSDAFSFSWYNDKIRRELEWIGGNVIYFEAWEKPWDHGR